MLSKPLIDHKCNQNKDNIDNLLSEAEIQRYIDLGLTESSVCSGGGCDG